MKILFIVIPILWVGREAIKIGVPSILIVVIAAVGVGSFLIAREARIRTGKISPARAADLAYYNRVRKEIGIDPYTPHELYTMRLQDNEAQDKASREIAATFGLKTYRDASGHLRDVYTNRHISQGG